MVDRCWNVCTNKADRAWLLVGIEDEREAALLYDRMAKKLHGKRARLNVPDVPSKPAARDELQRERPAATSRYLGVVHHEEHTATRWIARISFGGGNHELGGFERQPALAYDRAALYVNPDVADRRLNFPHLRARLKPTSPAELRVEARREHKKTTHSRFRGVSRLRGKWTANISKDGRMRFLGAFEDEEWAAAAYNRAARKLYGADAKLNFDPRTGDELCGQTAAGNTRGLAAVAAR